MSDKIKKPGNAELLLCNIPNGYKQTEIGIIPQDWEVKELRRILKVKHGKCQHEIETKNGQNPILATGGQIGKTNSYLYDKPSVLIGRKGTIDVPQYIEKPFWTVDTLFYTIIKQSNSVKFLFYKFNMINWYNYNESSGVPSLNAKRIEQIKIPLPPTLKEQELIAGVLSDMDSLLDNLDALIAKKKLIKQGVMQELLTGKKRLSLIENGKPQKFKEPWIENKLPKIVWFQEGPGVRTNQFTNKGVKLLNGTNIQKGKLILENTTRHISNKEAFGIYSHFLADNSDIIIACSGITIDKFDEKVTVVSNKNLPLCMNTSTMRFKIIDKDFDEKYFLYYLKSQYFKNQIGGKATGSAQLNFGPSHIEKVFIKYPKDIKEQEAIAKVLSDIDCEIEELENKKNKYKQIKEGAMQQLLTGKVRLV